MSSSNAFTDMPAAGLGHLYIQVLAIFSSKWMTFLSISGITLLLFYLPYQSLFFPFPLVLQIFFMTISFDHYEYYLEAKASSCSIDTGACGHSDPLLISNLVSLSGWLIIPLCFLVVVLVPILLVISIIHGMTIRVAAETYAGLRPTHQLLHCLADGWRNKWKITFVSLILTLPNLLCRVILYIDFPTLLIRAGFRTVLLSWWTPILLKVVFHVVSALTCAVMAASTSMIVVENKSVLEAIKSSWYLCWASFPLLFPSLLSWFVLHTLVWILPNSHYMTIIVNTASMLESIIPT